MIKVFHRLIWVFLLEFVAACEVLYRFLCRLYVTARWSYDPTRNKRKTLEKEELQFLEQCKVQITKLPKHLCVILGPNAVHVNEDVLLRLFNYALILDVNYVSLYDTRYMVDSSYSTSTTKDSLSATLDTFCNNKDVGCNQVKDMHYIWTGSPQISRKYSSESNGKILCNGYANGAINSKSKDSRTLNGNGYIAHNDVAAAIKIFIISPEDGRPLIAKICRTLYEHRDSNHVQALVQDRSKLTAHIDNELSKCLHNLPEPELGIIFNNYNSTCGMLPWQTRFTEFHNVDLICSSSFNAKTFASVLFRYSRCEQRWGK